MLSSLKKVRYPLSTLIVLVTLCGFGSCWLRLLVVTVSEEDVGAQRANELLWHVGSTVRVPKTATKVRLWARFHSAFASFQISEQEFLDWTRKRGWKLEPIRDGHCKAMGILSQCFEPDFPESILDGYSFSNSSHRGGWDVAYDRNTKRAWVSYARN